MTFEELNEIFNANIPKGMKPVVNDEFYYWQSSKKQQMITPSKEFWEVFKSTNGALSCAEALAIMNIAAQAPQANRCVEFGVYKGKSAMSAAYVLNYALFYLVEPEFKNKKFQTEVELILKKIQPDVTKVDYSFSSMISTEWLNDNERDFGYVFVDSGSHQDGLPMQEVKLLEDRMVQGGIIAFHDFKSQFVEVEQAYNYLLNTGKYEEVNIDWDEIVRYIDENNIEEGNQSWHHTELKNPCFVGAVRRK